MIYFDTVFLHQIAAIENSSGLITVDIHIIMSYPSIHVKATFVSTKAGSTPTISIENPIDITDHIAVINCNQYHQLKEEITTLVENQSANLFFHQDKEHIYKFDESSLASGGLHGLLEKRK